MTFEFAYRTSDGERKTDTISARSSDEAFAALRARGIRPIKLYRAKPDGFFGRLAAMASSRVGISAAAAVAAAAITAFAIMWLAPGAADKPASGPVRGRGIVNDAYKALEQKVREIEAAHTESFQSVDFELLHNYALIAAIDDMHRLYSEISKARIIIGNTRERLRAIFADVPQVFANDKDALSAAQSMYGEAVSRVDADEAQVDSDEAAIALLNDNRDKWRVVKGRVLFSDESLRRDFVMLSQEVDAATARWHRDFAPRAAVESNVIALPAQPE